MLPPDVAEVVDFRLVPDPGLALDAGFKEYFDGVIEWSDRRFTDMLALFLPQRDRQLLDANARLSADGHEGIGMSRLGTAFRLVLESPLLVVGLLLLVMARGARHLADAGSSANPVLPGIFAGCTFPSRSCSRSAALPISFCASFPRAAERSSETGASSKVSVALRL